MLAAGVFPRLARAEEQARLVYVRSEGAEACPDEVALRLRVVARLSYDPFSPRASRVVVARIDAAPKSLHGSVELVDAQGMSSGKRELSSTRENCDELARAMALSISLAIDPEREQAPRREPPAEPAVPPGPPSAPPPAPLRQDSPQSFPAPRASSFFGAVALVGVAGALPAPALGGLGSLGFRSRYFSAALEGRALWSLERELSPRGHVRGSLVGPGLSACGQLSHFGGCLVAVAAVQALESSGVSAGQARSAAFVGLGPRLTFRSSAPPQSLAFTASLEGLWSLTRNSAQFSGAEIWKTPALSGAAMIGIDLPFL
jgi:hypothetical protein